MTFEEFWAERVARALEHPVAMRNMAMMAWDAALCAAQDRNFENGQMRSALEITATLSELHSWNSPAASRPAQPEPKSES